ncbi:MAG: CopD family protein [Nitrospirota bacterium]|nr:CopD family protein [Nitrospirota bacterium]
MRSNFVISLLSLFLAIIPSLSSATPDYAKQTGFECGTCHVDAIGGGKLTTAGEQFISDLKAKGQYRQLSMTQHMVRLVVGYLHMLAAVVWFGTILYVHLLLKPAYASKGLPRGELRLGMLSMVVIAATGTLLTIARMPNLDAFISTRFGVLLSIKIVLFLVMVTSAVITITYIGPRLRKKLKSPVAALISRDITAEQLSHFDGKDGHPAYIAYKGMVYDITNSRLWKNGAHMVKHHAGTDLTEALGQAPHKEDKVLAMPQVGMLVAADRKPERPFHERLFYFFAYMNLALVFVIIFVISLWRWW